MNTEKAGQPKPETSKELFTRFMVFAENPFLDDKQSAPTSVKTWQNVFKKVFDPTDDQDGMLDVNQAIAHDNKEELEKAATEGLITLKGLFLGKMLSSKTLFGAWRGDYIEIIEKILEFS